MQQAIATTHPPAKLNLFLELIRKRLDGFHDIDTVMVAIDWCDRLRLQLIDRPEIELTVDWLPSRTITANRLGVAPDAAAEQSLLNIPHDETNLVHRALQRFRQHYGIVNGFRCELLKNIPSGAGLGGASSDAAAALRCAATLCQLPLDHPDLAGLAAEIGSDVPFFLGSHQPPSPNPWRAARAEGRGERLSQIPRAPHLHFVVVFPAVSLSTASIYAKSSVPAEPASSERLICALSTGSVAKIAAAMENRLQEPATKIVPEIEEIFKSMWHWGLFGCQLTGSGSACFALANSVSQAKRAAIGLRSQFERRRCPESHSPHEVDVRQSPQSLFVGARVVRTHSTFVPAKIQIDNASSF